MTGMNIAAVISVIIVAIAALYLFCIAPNRKDRRDKMKPFEEVFIAHRGLFDNKGEAPENSLPAFKKAVDGGFGIELDVQMTSDGKLVVFHDESLKRMCKAEKILHKCSYEELKQYKLAESEEQIPLFDEVLKTVGGKVPLIVEVKSEGDWKTTTRLTAERLDRYKGCYCMESFHPFSVRWFRKNRPGVIRGQLSTNFFRDNPERNWCEKLVLTNLLFNFLSRPDFIAYNHLWENQFSYKICRKLFPVENAAWTIKSQQELEEAKKVFNIFIFDGFIPKK